MIAVRETPRSLIWVTQYRYLAELYMGERRQIEIVRS
jgi:hypothetical protein